MYLAIPSQPDCASAWLVAIQRLNARSGREANNVIINVTNPTLDSLNNPVVARVNDFLTERGKAIECIANTIFPEALYARHGMPDFMAVFHNNVLPQVRRNRNWSGYYFERMTRLPRVGGGPPIDQLSRMIERIRNESNNSLNKHEISLFDPERDVNGAPYGGQCLSFLSFHLLPGSPKTLVLTAQYRNHYYTEKLLGNLISLGRLMRFVARESGVNVGALTVISTHATVDTPGASRNDIKNLIADCQAAIVSMSSAA